MAQKKAAARKRRKRARKTEAVDRAFDEILFEHKVSAGLNRLAASGGLRNVDPAA
jgi:hypothetical protein